MKRILVGLLIALLSLNASAAVIKTVQAGAADQTVVIKIIDSTDGTPETGVVFNTSGIDIEYWRHGANAVTDITEVTQTVNGAHTDGGFVALGNGYYRLDLPDAAVASGATAVEVMGTVTGMIVIGGTVQLSPPVDVASAAGVAWTSGAITAAVIATDAITASEIATDAIGAAEIASDAIGSAELASGAITAAEFGAGAIDATAIATDAIGAAEIAANAIAAAEIADGAIDAATYATTAGSFFALGVVDQGTAQAATSTTLQLRAAAAFADDEIIGATCVITGGSAGVGQARTITDYVSSTDTATVATWTTTPTGTVTYQCFGTAAGSSSGGATAADVWAYATRSLTILDEDSTTLDLNATAVGSVAGAVGSVTGAVGSVTGAVGSVTGSVGSVATGGITAASIATDAIGAAEIAADAGTELGTATWATTTRSLTILDEDSTTLDLNATAVGSLTTVTNILTGLRDTVIEDMGSVTWGCAMAALLAGVAGDLDVTGSSGIYEDPSGTETRITYTISGDDRTVTLTCPSY